jgi:hypothetical protein
MRYVIPALALALAAPTSAAAEDLTWTWEEGQSLRYFLQTAIKFQSNFPMASEIKYDFLAQDLLITTIVNCTATEAFKKRTALSCTFEEVGLLAGAGNATSTQAVQAILDEWKAKIEAATYLTSMTPGGRLGVGELDGIEWGSENRRTNRIANAMEQVIDRMFASLDVGLPKPGKTWEDGWIAKNHLSMMIPTSSGGNGLNKVTFTVDATEGSTIDVLLSGDGTIMEGVDTQAPRAYSFEMDGVLRFDQAKGEMVAHAYRSTGTLTASSVSLPGRRPEGGAANSAPATDVVGPTRGGGDSVGSQGSGASSFNTSLTRGGAYDPNSYFETGRAYVLADGETPDVGETGPMAYPTNDPADPASGAAQE